MLEVAGGILYISLLTLAYGLIGLQGIALLTGDENKQIEFSTASLVGLSLLSFLTTCLTLVIAIDGRVHIILLGGAVLWLWIFRKKSPLKQIDFQPEWLKNPISLIIVFISIVSILVETSGIPTNYDTGLYHAQTVQWINKFPIILGLGNLHGRFAYDSSWHILGALFSFSFLGSQPARLVNAFIRLCIVIFFVSKSVRPKSGQYLPSNGLAMIFLFILQIQFWSDTNSLTADMPASFVVWVIFLLFAEKLEDWNDRRWDLRSSIILLLSIFAVTIKLSTFPVFVMPLALVVLERDRSGRPFFLRAGLLGCIFGFPWLIRNFLLSGYLVYPVPFLKIFSPDWQIPVAAVQAEAYTIMSWARLPHMEYQVVMAKPFWEWFAIWLPPQNKVDLFLILFGLITNVVFTILNVCHIIQKRSQLGEANNQVGQLILRISALSGFIYWFVTAPDIRFGLSFITPLFILAFLPPGPMEALKSRFLRASIQRLPLFVQSGILIVVILAVYVDFQFRVGDFHFIQQSDYPAAATTKRDLSSGLSVLVPVNSDQCWNEPIPCTPYPNDQLELRGKSINAGFRIRPAEVGADFGSNANPK